MNPERWQIRCGRPPAKTDLAKRANALTRDAIYDTDKMARNEARPGKAFAGLLGRYFK